MADLLTIGEVAARAGLRTSALRYYEEEGLVRPASRESGRRRYDPSVLHRLAVIGLFQDVGFSIREIRRLLKRGGTAWRPHAARKLRELDDRIARTGEARELLLTVLACDCDRLEGCDRVRGGHRRRPLPGGGPARPSPRTRRRPA
ncbi:MAG TPA: MerR family transcriptional regulator [Actinomycetota bacterium]